MLKAAEACHKGGHPFGIGLGQTEDNVDTAGAIFQSFGAELVDAKGNITVKTDAVRQALEYYKKLAQFLPPDAPAWDNASNNKYLISGKGALIMNPPSAWAVAKRDAPQVAEQCWTHGMPAGPKGRFAPFLPYFWGIWSFSKNKPAAKSLLLHLSQPAAVEKMVVASGGYDLPAFEKLTTLKVWAEEGPPKGTLYHYPNPHNHQILSVARRPAPPKIAAPDLHPGDPDQDGRALHAGRAAGKDAGLGRERSRRLHADLSSALRCGDAARAHAGRPASASSRRGLADGRCGIARRLGGDTARRRRAGLRRMHAAEVDHRVPDGAAAHPADRAAGRLSGALFDPSRDTEQVDGALRRLRQFHLPVQARNLLDGGEAVLHLRHHRGDLQSLDRLHRRPFRPQHSRARASASGAACCWCHG